MLNFSGKHFWRGPRPTGVVGRRGGGGGLKVVCVLSASVPAKIKKTLLIQYLF